MDEPAVFRSNRVKKYKSDQEVMHELLDRVTRLESRLVQLFYFLGADINERYNVKDKK